MLLKYFCQPGCMDVFAQAIKFTETHNKRIPFVGVNVMSLFRIQDGLINVNANNSNFDRHREIFRRAELMKLLDHCFRLYSAFSHSRWTDNVRWDWGKSRVC